MKMTNAYYVPTTTDDKHYLVRVIRRWFPAIDDGRAEKTTYTYELASYCGSGLWRTLADPIMNSESREIYSDSYGLTQYEFTDATGKYLIRETISAYVALPSNPEVQNKKTKAKTCKGMEILCEEAAKEAVAKIEAKNIRNTFELLRKVAPDMDKKTLVKLIAKKYKRTVKYVKSIADNDEEDM